jgi:2-oxoglutarate dehydrogenase complex dehydrogenase (E1) component-like enzyme
MPAAIGAEFMHITDVEQRRWMYERLEAAGGNYGLSGRDKQRILERLTAAEGLERYLHTKYVGQKRFSLEGGDSLIPLLDVMIQRAGGDGVKDIVIGMAHRGRLNVLVNTLGKPPRKLFDEFEGKFEHDDPAPRRRREVPHGLLRRHRHPRRPGAPGAGLQPVAPGDRRPGGRRLGAFAPGCAATTRSASRSCRS